MINSWKAQIVCWIVEIYQPSQWESSPNANTLLHHGRTKVKDDADEMQVICGGLDAFLDFEKSSSILFSCLSQMSISVIIMLNFGANNRVKIFFQSIWFIQTWEAARSNTEIFGSVPVASWSKN